MKRDSATDSNGSAKRARSYAVGGKELPSLGAPSAKPRSQTYVTAGQVVVISEVLEVEDPLTEVQELSAHLDRSRGVLLSSSYEYPGRYGQWSLGFVDPPVCLEAWSRKFRISALNCRGRPFLPTLLEALQATPAVAAVQKVGSDKIEGEVKQTEGYFAEEDRSKQPSVFSVVRAIVNIFESHEDSHLGLYGAFGYDLAFQFENIKLHKDRDPSQRDLVMYIPDNMLIINHQMQSAWRMKYDFAFAAGGKILSTKGMHDKGPEVHFKPRTQMPPGKDRRELKPGEFAKQVDVAKEKFKRGDLFEAVLSQTFREPCKARPSEVFHCLQRRNPSPYGFLMNLGEEEYLVGASPEMFVRVESNLKGLRVETCPISGTIRRGKDALEDAENIKTILADPKEESEITMCTDVDRNDKSRICEHGSVQVIGRRQIELYSKLIHTVDHVEGYLRPEFDAIDAFLVHTWAVTVCGAPKAWAMQFVEEMEPSQRCWYGASVGHVAFDGHLNTGLTLRTVRIKEGVAEVRAGATLLFDSVPESEEKETELKASACLNAVRNPHDVPSEVPRAPSLVQTQENHRVVLIDFEDSFVHTLANYIRQTGATVTTVRHTQAEHMLAAAKPDLVVLSPGPGRPTDFGVSKHIERLLTLGCRIFGVCLGLQSIVEHFGGRLGQLPLPMHGKPTEVQVREPGTIFKTLPSSFVVARYHSLYGLRPLPECLLETATVMPGLSSGDGIEPDKPILMGIQHKTLPIAAVQFHPESILTSPELGVQMLVNAFSL
ncbi:unnamed protein product [Effrenium voratum]|uniref:p-aminobenzoic acid synthase n=1 Tax=Effrenium voratum TaxID=2562239 RepID=A0AA36JIF3_9DINO|nr:unnamed protein product [Effrenium voratum]